MNIMETTNALALAQAYDNRTVGEGNVRAWHLVLGNLDADDVMEAIRRHYAAETAWVMPAHINRLVDEIRQEREKAARKWAPGQHGVPVADAVPELPRGERLTAADVTPRIVDLLAQLRAELPEMPREVLFPRQVAWEREQAAYRRASGGEPNPLYRPGGPVAPVMSEEDRLRELCRISGAHDDGVHADMCPDLPHEHRASCHGPIGERDCGHP